MPYLYHSETVHRRGAMPRHTLDRASKPQPFKVYSESPFFPLPEGNPSPLYSIDFWKAALASKAQGATLPSTEALSTVLRHGAGLARPVRDHSGGPRAWASAGALYPCEVYCQTLGLSGLQDGLYHFSPWDAEVLGAALRLIRPDEQGQTRSTGAALNQAEGGHEVEPSFTVIITGLFQRSAWKYLDRAYRYVLLDAGHLIANLELAAAALGLAPRICLNFADHAAAGALGLNMAEEAPLVLLRCAAAEQANADWLRGGNPRADISSPLPATGLIARAQAATLLETVRPEPVWGWSPQPDGVAGALGSADKPAAYDQGDAIAAALAAVADPSLETVLRLRRSGRVFSGEGLRPEEMDLLLRAAMPGPVPFNVTVVTAGGNGQPAGRFLYAPTTSGERFLLPAGPLGDWRAVVAEACLGQTFAAEAAVQAVLWADLRALEARFGPRGYRHLMLAAGRFGQRFYLAATALGLSCCGIAAFYDEELRVAAGLPDGGAPLYCLVAGRKRLMLCKRVIP